MKTNALRRGFIAAAVVTCGIAGSLGWSKGDGLSFSVTSAEARVGRPLTPLSYAGVARRTTRRAVVGGAIVGGAAVGAAGYCHRVLINGAWVCR